ncbi:MAG: lycopene cyclase domain-containing protein [Chloroflexi bacterium]|nr:lycopene cyclase domain-containing protein [Chloroflexota bacterium]
MTYPRFLLLFLCPPLAMMLAATRRPRTRPAWLALASLMAIALAYTTPWDNYLVVRGVWSFENDRIRGVFPWRAPLEEYLFYPLQVLLTGPFTPSSHRPRR